MNKISDLPTPSSPVQTTNPVFFPRWCHQSKTLFSFVACFHWPGRGQCQASFPLPSGPISSSSAPFGGLSLCKANGTGGGRQGVKNFFAGPRTRGRQGGGGGGGGGNVWRPLYSWPFFALETERALKKTTFLFCVGEQRGRF